MAQFDVSKKADRDLRHCKTHAFAARLFAAHPRHPSNAQVWEEVARAWDNLAHLKMQVAETKADIAQTVAELKRSPKSD